MIPEDVRSRLVMQAARSSRREICGFVTVDWQIIPVDNVARHDAPHEFEMHHEQTIAAYTLHDLLGMYHSHPGGTVEPSADDRRYAPYGLRYFIVTSTEVIEWEISDDRTTAQRADVAD